MKLRYAAIPCQTSNLLPANSERARPGASDHHAEARRRRGQDSDQMSESRATGTEAQEDSSRTTKQRQAWPPDRAETHGEMATQAR